MSRRSSSRKEDLVQKVNKKEVLEINSDDDDEDKDDDKTEDDDAEVVSLSDASSDEVIAPKKQRNVSYNKAAFSMPDDISKLMNRVLCTACGKQLNPMNHGAIRKHPWLKVITCKKCYKFLKSGPFTRDEDGTDEQCRWCGDGGRLYGCDYCNNCFCRSCIKRNIGRTEAAEMESEEATKSKWKCYMCKPKKIKTLQDNCSKILDYIKKEEDKEKAREERAKQREKEKAQAKKEKKEADKKDKRNSLPLPIKPKTDLNDSREKTPNKTSGFPAPKPKDSIVIDDSPEKPVNKLATAKSHLPTYQSRPGDGVTQVQVGNGVTQVTVGPKAKQPVSMPYKDGLKMYQAQPQGFAKSSSLQNLLAPKPKPIQPLPYNRPNLLGALTTQFPSANANVSMVDKKGITQVAKNNDIRALKEQIVPFNVETITEKLSTVAQAFSLTLNHVKTDLAIAKISSSNLFNSRSSAAYSVKTGLDVFCNNLRDIFNVQITTSSPSSEEPITLDDDKTSVKGLPNGNDLSIDKDSANESDKKEIKEDIKQEIKKEIKKETNGPIIESKDQVKPEKNSTEEKMETNEGDSKEISEKDTKIEKKEKSENSDENNDKMETSDKEQNEDKDNESEGDTSKDKDTSSTSKTSNKSSRKESDKSENTAAELDILKELADEINEANEKEESMEEETETRRSSRRKKSQQDSQEDNEEGEADKSSETEQTLKRSSSRRKLQSDEKESQDEKKNQKNTKKTTEKEKNKDVDADGSSETDQEQRRSSRRKPEEKEKGKDSKDNKDINNSPDKNSKVKDKNDTKNSKSTTKSEKGKEADKTSVNDTGDDNEDISSDSDSSVSSAEFGKRRTRRKQKEKDEDKAKSESKSKGAKSERTKSKDKSEKSDKKDKEKTDKKESRSTRSKRSSDDKEEEYHSDSSNFDADLEKDIKSLSKDTKLTRSSRRTGKDESDSTEKEDKGGKKTSGKGKLDKNKKEDSVEESDDSQDKSNDEEEETADNPPADTKDEKKIKGKGWKSKNKKEESDDDADTAEDTKDDKKTKGKGGKSKNKKEESDDDADADEDGEDDGKEDEEDDGENEEVDEDDLSPAQLRKLRAAQKKDEESDYEDMVASDNSDSEDPEVSFPKLSTPKKGQNKRGKGKKDDSVTIESDDSDFVTPKKNKKRKLKSDLLDAKVSDSDSDVGSKKKKKGRGKKRKKEEEEDEEPDPEDEVYSDDEKKKKGKGKRKRIRKVASSSDEEKEKGEEGGDEGEDDENDLEDTPGGAHKRKKIRKVMANKKLADSTKEARKVEEERRKRIEERQKEFNAYVEVEGGEEEEEVPEGTEREKKEGDDSIAKILGTAKKVPVTTKCVLDMEKDTKKVLVEIDRTLVKKLKPHQVEAVRFMYNCCVESVERMKKEEGAGCILAHCMGLGKTLSVISFLHTMLKNTKLTKTTKCLVVCPLNTVLNWVNEFEIWLEDVDYEIEVYEMSKVKQNYERAQMLREWHEGGAGVMILGYDMYRNLVNGSHCKNKKQKATFYETLAVPGPDIVVCDEGHILKNDQTSLSKAMMKIKTRRRVVLTGTPLQNNLGEYHCMVSFVKPNLLGTRKEFSNRFVNPITNGQCSDSTGSDVKLMKRRAHILHEMLAGCVQRKDYSALTKFLPPKFEYVVSVRMSPLQCTLYENYLKEVGIVQNEEIKNKGGRLFRDYQALMRIWTHPWVLKLDEIRQENKKPFDDSEDSFIDDETDDDGEDSFISGSTTSESDADFNPKSKQKKKKSKGKKGKKRGSDSDSDSDVKEVGEENEVIKKWSSKRRGNEEGAGSSWMQDMGYATGPKEVSDEWWAQYVKEEDEFKIELSGKLSLMFEILRMCEDIGDKVLIFSQSLLSLDIIEDFLHYVDESNNKEEGEEGENKDNKDKKEEEAGGSGTSEKKEKTEEEKKKEEQKKEQEKKREKYAQYGKSWTVGADYFRMDGSTSSQQRKAAQDSFNDPENYRARLFLISTKAGSLGINLVAANRVIIFDASWNPSHDIQSIFRVYRFGQIKPVYVYRFLAQGTMEEKIYERQVTKQSLSQRVVDEHQIERHFTANDLQELYKFQPDRLDDPDRKERPLPMLPKDHMLAELMSTQKDWIVTFHEHDSLLENIIEQELSEDEKKAAWEDYENEKKGLNTGYAMYGNMMNAQQRMNSALEFQNLVLQGQANLGQEAVLQIVQDLKARFPTLPPEVFSQRVQAVLRQVLTQRIMQQSDFQRRQLDQQKMAELNRLNQIKQQIQQQQAMLNSQQRSMGVGGNYYNSLYGVQALPSSGFSNNLMARAMGLQNIPAAHSSQSSLPATQKSNSNRDKK